MLLQVKPPTNRTCPTEIRNNAGDRAYKDKRLTPFKDVSVLFQPCIETSYAYGNYREK